MSRKSSRSATRAARLRRTGAQQAPRESAAEAASQVADLPLHHAATAATDLAAGSDSAAGSNWTASSVGLLAQLLGAVLLASMFPYTSQALSRYQAWQPGDGVPVARLFARREEETLAPVVPPEEISAFEDGASEPTGAPQVGTLVVEPREYDGLPQEIEDPTHAMRAFYQSLRRTVEGNDAHVTHVAHFGDSSIALDGITQTARQRLQRRFGDAGHGFVLAARGSQPYRHLDVRHDSSGWQVPDITRRLLGSPANYGIGGSQARSSGGATSRVSTASAGAPVGTRVSRFDILYQAFAHGGDFHFRVDDGEWQAVSTRGDEADLVHSVLVEDGPHELEVRAAGHGETRLYGLVLERAGPGVVYDSLGMVGARVRRLTHYRSEHLTRQLAMRSADLIVLGFGGNDADDERTLDEYTADFRAAARLFRHARPEASCLLFATLDQGFRDERGVVRTLPAIPLVVEATRRAALAEGCAFYNTYAAMGGDGAMSRWVRQSPRLGTGDYRHATPAGYRTLGTWLYQAIMKGLHDEFETH